MRKIVQIVIGENMTMYALCDDGTVWARIMMSGWARVNTDDVVNGDERA
jgi:hypothetical protein